MRKLALSIAVLVVLMASIFFTVPTIVDGRMNTVTHPGPYAASAQASIAHQALFVADLHDDALLWNRDLLQRYDRGHSDLPRLLDGHMALQVFATVTKTPKGMNYERNSADTDNVTMLATEGLHPLEGKLENVDRLYDAVALGSDFNGATRTPFDVTGLPQLTEGLIQAGFSENDIRAIMGGNVQRLLLQSLPPV